MSTVSSTTLITKYGKLKVSYHQFENNSSFEGCVSLANGDLSSPNCIVRIHSSCLFGESFSTIDCDCDLQLQKSLKLIAEKGGVIIYLYQEGRGLGLANKIKAMNLELTEGIDTADAFTKLNFDLDPRKYTVAIKALRELGVNKNIRLISNNPRKIIQLEEAGFTITEKVKLTYPRTKLVKSYLKVKKEKLGHDL